MKCTPTQQASERMRAIRALCIGQEADNVAAIFDVTHRTLNRWIQAFNEEGIDGLIDDPRPGRPRKLSDDISAQLVEAVTNPSSVGETHWTAVKLHGYVTKILETKIGYSTVVRWLHENDFALRVPRPWPDRQDQVKRREYVASLQGWLQDGDIELWFGDESGFEGDPRPRKRWVEVGSRPTRVKNGDHLRMNVLGAVCPRTGEFFALEADTCNSDVFQAFLDEAQTSLQFERPTNYLILDNASWHKTKTLNWGKFTPIYLPAYSPDFNPIERLWLALKDEFFSDFIAKNKQQLITRLDEALLWAMKRQGDNKRTCTIKTAL